MILVMKLLTTLIQQKKIIAKFLIFTTMKQVFLKDTLHILSLRVVNCFSFVNKI